MVTRLQASVWPSALESVEASLLVRNRQWKKKEVKRQSFMIEQLEVSDY